jgi:uncharacterized membrane protein YfcA
MLFLAALGAVAGVLTTIVGAGGGLFLILVLTLQRGSHEALAVTAPALLASNLHRAFLYRTRIARPIAVAFALGAVPGSIVGGFVLSGVPAWVLEVLIVCGTLFAIGRYFGWIDVQPTAPAIVPAGAGIGVLAATTGGAGLLAGPLFMSAGLSGEAYIATMSLSATLLGVGRVLGYGFGGLLRGEHLTSAMVLFAGLIAGNFAGKKLRVRMERKTEARIELSALLVCAALVVCGVTR